jgi:hypothetical protein
LSEGKVVRRKCPMCDVTVETDIHPVACSVHRAQVEKDAKHTMATLRAKRKKKPA